MVRLYLPKERYNKEANEEKRKKKNKFTEPLQYLQITCFGKGSIMNIWCVTK